MNTLITKALTERNAEILLSFNTDFLNIVEKKYIDWIAEYYSNYNECPTLGRFESEFKSFIRSHTKEPLKALFDEELKKKKNLYFRQKVMEMEEELVEGADPTELIKNLNETFSISNSDVVTTKTYDRSKYFEVKDITPTFIPFVDRFTGGIQRGELVYLTGRPGSNKTTLAESIITKWVLIGKKILYVSNENGPDEVMPKLDGFIGGFNPIHNRFGDWSEEDKLKVEAASYIFGSVSGNIEIVRDPVSSSKEIELLIKTHKPDLVLIDGTYLMTDSGRLTGDWKDLAEVSRNLKRIARKTKTPILGVIQANRNAEGQKVGRDNLAGTDAYLQDADCIISANVIDGVSIGQIIKSRWGATPFSASFKIKAHFESMYLETEENEEFISETGIEEVDDW